MLMLLFHEPQFVQGCNESLFLLVVVVVVAVVVLLLMMMMIIMIFDGPASELSELGEFIDI